MANNVTSDLLRFAELPRAGAELASLLPSAPWLSLAPRGKSHPVVVIPGFFASDISTRPLRAYLRFLGYQAHPWEQGRNLGSARMGGYEQLVNHVLRIHRESGQRVSLVGWSLGGIHALAVAQRAAYAVARVITLGSPVVQDGTTTSTFQSLRAAAAAINGTPINTPTLNSALWRDAFERTAERTPVSSIYSKSDIVVPWQRSHLPTDRDGLRTENIQVFSSHMGMVVNPTAMFAVADRLALKPGTLKPISRFGWRAGAFPPT